MITKKQGQSVLRGVVADYFTQLRAIHDGDSDAVDKMLELWDEDGVCTLCGAPPVTGQFRGRAPLAALYRSLLSSPGMRVRAEDDPTAELTMGKTSIHIDRARDRGNKVVVEWTSSVNTNEGKQFEVSGSNTFSIQDDKIVDLDIVISPRPGSLKGFKVTDLSLADIGRLSLAAWAVV